MKKGFIALCFTLCIGYAMAQQEHNTYDNPYKVNTLRLEARVDFDYQLHHDTTPSQGGFAGRYLNFVLDGQLTHRFSYHYRQRLNIANVSFSSFFKGCDWIHLDYHAGKHFTISAGKQPVAIGGWEYDAPPIDVLYWSNFWDNVICYEMGASVSFHDTAHHHTLMLQVCNSPFVSRAFENLYAYNLIWYGNMQCFSTAYSFNMIEYSKGKYISYIALGNQFTFHNFSFYIDIMNRASFRQQGYWFRDFTAIAKFNYNFNGRGSLFIKGGYDMNHAQSALTEADLVYDRFVLPGTEYAFVGLGGTFMPVKNSDCIRLHAFFAMNNTHDITCQFNAGATWRMDFLKISSSIKQHKAQKNKENNIISNNNE